MHSPLEHILVVIQKSITENCMSLTQLAKCYEDTGDKFQNSSKSLSEIIIDKSEINSENESASFATLKKLATNEFSSYRNFGFAGQAFKFKIANEIHDCLEDYRRLGDDLLRKFNECNDALKESQRIKEESYEKYIEAGNAVKQAFETGSKNLQLCRDNFVKAQKEALESYNKNKSENVRVQTSIEYLLCDYENLEKWRVESLQKLFKEVASNFKHIGTLFQESSTAINSELNSIDENGCCKSLMNCSYIKDACASPKYQIVSVPPIASSFLDMSQVWKDEINNGAKIGNVRDNYKSEDCNQLDAKQNEVVLVLEDLGDNLKCMNINDCIGLLPSSVVSVC